MLAVLPARSAPVSAFDLAPADDTSSAVTSAETEVATGPDGPSVTVAVTSAV